MDFSFILNDPAFSGKLASIDRKIGGCPANGIPELFREIPLDIFAILAAERPRNLPNISAWLPGMPPADVQKRYVGFAGADALLRSSAFVAEAVQKYEELTNRKIFDARILDYGVGWGRILRLFYKYVPVDRTYAVDAFKSSFEMAKGLGLRSRISLIPEVPGRIRVVDDPIDLIWVFSVFTHLSESAADSVLQALYETLAPDGLAIITIRPEHACHSTYPHLRKAYEATGFSFASQVGQSNYGDTVMSLDFFRKRWPQWTIADVSWEQHNYLQLKLYLRKR